MTKKPKNFFEMLYHLECKELSESPGVKRMVEEYIADLPQELNKRERRELKGVERKQYNEGIIEILKMLEKGAERMIYAAHLNKKEKCKWKHMPYRSNADFEVYREGAERQEACYQAVQICFERVVLTREEISVIRKHERQKRRELNEAIEQGIRSAKEAKGV